MIPSFRFRALLLVAMGLSAVLWGSGCAPHSTQTAPSFTTDQAFNEDFKRIQGDMTLSQSEKDRRILALKGIDINVGVMTPAKVYRQYSQINARADLTPDQKQAMLSALRSAAASMPKPTATAHP